jgi:uncharacterized membrane protein YciS (DUF1049 family)
MKVFGWIWLAVSVGWFIFVVFNFQRAENEFEAYSMMFLAFSIGVLLTSLIWAWAGSK